MAANGDTVTLLPGGAGDSYAASEATPVRIRHVVHVVGDTGSARPLVKVDSSSTTGTSGFSVETDAAGTTISHVAFQTTGFLPIQAPGRVDMSDIAVKASEGCLYLTGANSSLTDSSLETSFADTPNGICLYAQADGVVVRNVEVTDTGGVPGANGTAAQLFGAGIRVEGIRVRSAGQGVRLGGSEADPAVMRRADVRGGGLGVTTSNAILTDSLIVMNSANAAAAIGVGGTLRNVTAIATGTGSRGLHLRAAEGSVGSTTDVRNSILRGDDKDVSIEETYPGQGTPGCNPVIDVGCIAYIPPRTAGTLVIGNSNFRTTQVGPGGVLTDAGGNSAADPLFVNAGAGDFHLSFGSPGIDTGADSPQNGSQDLDGATRKQGAAVDMGAYEYPTAVLSPDSTKPLVTGLSETNRVFAVGREPTPVAAKRHERGTTFVFKSSEAGAATLTISRVGPGRRRGKQCVKPTKKNRRGRHCTRHTRVRPSLRRTIAAGATAVPFSGRIGKRALKTGSYRLTVIVADAAGNRSKPRSVAFRVVRR